MAVNTRLANRRAVVPVGTIIAFYDFGVLDFDTKTWAYCEGQTISDVDSPLDGIALPDLSGRYLIGYGTEKSSATLDTDGYQDMGTDTYSRNLVGRQGDVFDFVHSHDHNHYHTLSSHTHSFSHTHNISPHYHYAYHTHNPISLPNHRHKFLTVGYEDKRYTRDPNGWLRLTDSGSGYDGLRMDERSASDYWTGAAGSKSKNQYAHTYSDLTDSDSSATTSGALSSGSGHEALTETGGAYGNTGSLNSGRADLFGRETTDASWTDPRIGSTTDIRPRSVKIRFIMRIA